MSTFLLFIVMTSPPQFYQGEGVACSLSIQTGAPMYVLKARAVAGGPDKEVVVDEVDNNLRLARPCDWVNLTVGGHAVKVLRESPEDK